MNSKVLAKVVIAASLLPLSGMSCAPDSLMAGFLARQKQDRAALLAETTPAEAPIGGSVIVILPNDKILGGTPGTGSTFPMTKSLLLRIRKAHLLNMVEVLRKRRLFDSVQLRQSANPQQEQFQEDFALTCQYVSEREWEGPEWSLRTRKRPQGEPLPIDTGPYALSYFQQAAIWLNSITESVKSTGAQ